MHECKDCPRLFPANIDDRQRVFQPTMSAGITFPPSEGEFQTCQVKDKGLRVLCAYTNQKEYDEIGRESEGDLD